MSGCKEHQALQCHIIVNIISEKICIFIPSELRILRALRYIFFHFIPSAIKFGMSMALNSVRPILNWA